MSETSVENVDRNRGRAPPAADGERKPLEMLVFPNRTFVVQRVSKGTLDTLREHLPGADPGNSDFGIMQAGVFYNAMAYAMAEPEVTNQCALTLLMRLEESAASFSGLERTPQNGICGILWIQGQEVTHPLYGTAGYKGSTTMVLSTPISCQRVAREMGLTELKGSIDCARVCSNCLAEQSPKEKNFAK